MKVMKVAGFSLHRNRLFQIAVVAIVILEPLRLMGFRDTLGPSMHPKYPSPITLVRVIKDDNLKEGDIVSFRHGGFFGTSVKWAKIIQPTQDGSCWVWAEGDNEDRSGDSRDFWWLRKSEIEGKVVWAWPSTSASVSPLFFSTLPPPPSEGWVGKQIMEEVRRTSVVVNPQEYFLLEDRNRPFLLQVFGPLPFFCQEGGNTFVLYGNAGRCRIKGILNDTLFCYLPKQHQVRIRSFVEIKDTPEALSRLVHFLKQQKRVFIRSTALTKITCQGCFFITKKYVL